MSIDQVFMFSGVFIFLLSLITIVVERKLSIIPIIFGLLLWVPSGDQTIVYNLSIPELYIYSVAVMLILVNGFLSFLLILEIAYAVSVTLYLSPDYKFGFYFLRNYLIIPFCLFHSMNFLLRNGTSLQYAKDTFSLVIAFFWTWIFVNDISGMFSQVGLEHSEGRLGGVPLLPFGSWAYLGSVQLGTLIGVSFAFSLSISNKVFKWMAVLLLLYLLFRTGSRGSMMAVFAMGIFSLIRHLFNRRFTWMTIVGIIIALILVVILGQNFYYIISLNDRLQTLTALDKDGSFGYRLLSISNAWIELGEHPFGTGFAREGKDIFNEHNLFAWISVAMGIPGIMLLLYKLRFLWNTEIFYLKLLVIAVMVNGFSDPMLMEGIQSLFISVVVCLGIIEFKMHKSGLVNL